MSVSNSVIEDLHKYRNAFLHANPFKHTVIENFFKPDFAERLLTDFPAFDPSLAWNEVYGGAWGKAVNTKIRSISPAYEEMYQLMGSAEFLGLMSEISGIPGLLPDPTLYGGGTRWHLF
jgi:hypothetical protein